jgi:hypothetical protein
MAKSGLPYNPDFELSAEELDLRFRPGPSQHRGWFRRLDEKLAAMQAHARATPGCRAIGVVHGGSGWGDTDVELIELRTEKMEYWCWTWWRIGASPGQEPRGGRSPSGIDLVAELAILRQQHPRLRCIGEPVDPGTRYKSLVIATPTDGDWLIRQSRLDGRGSNDAWERVAATIASLTT